MALSREEQMMVRVTEEEHVAYVVADLHARGDISIRQVIAWPDTKFRIRPRRRTIVYE